MSRAARRAAGWVWGHLVTVVYVAVCWLVLLVVTAAGVPAHGRPTPAPDPAGDSAPALQTCTMHAWPWP